MQQRTKKLLAFLVVGTMSVLVPTAVVDAKGPNGGVLTVKLSERNCDITGKATFDKSLYQSPTPTVAIRFRLVDENTNPVENGGGYFFSARDTQRISHTFNFIPDTTVHTYAIEVQLVDANGESRYQGGSDYLSGISCQYQ